jgi:hypothetical protein
VVVAYLKNVALNLSSETEKKSRKEQIEIGSVPAEIGAGY